MALTTEEFNQFFEQPANIILATLAGDGWGINYITDRAGENGTPACLIIGVSGDKAGSVSADSFCSAVLASKRPEGTILDKIAEANIVIEQGPKVKFA